jgi:polyhydroxybutyrate depolymerase
MFAGLIVAIAALSASPERMQWSVDGVDREGLVVAPQNPPRGGAPVVFVFHGHGGNMRQASRSFHLESLWPEAIVVYPQGLLTPSHLDPDGKRAGWQSSSGTQGDRDLKFFDAMLASVQKKWTVDESRIYATGHSNGAIFTYLLWSTHTDLFAAVAPSSAPKMRISLTKPLPVLHIASEQDRIAPFALQQATIKDVRRLNQCSEQGQQWAKGCTLYPSKVGTPLVVFMHEGGHRFPQEAPALIVRFLKEHKRAASKSTVAN